MVQQIKVLDLLILARYFPSNKRIKPYPSTDQHNRKWLFCLYFITFQKPTEFYILSLIGEENSLIEGISTYNSMPLGILSIHTGFFNVF